MRVIRELTAYLIIKMPIFQVKRTKINSQVNFSHIFTTNVVKPLKLRWKPTESANRPVAWQWVHKHSLAHTPQVRSIANGVTAAAARP